MQIKHVDAEQVFLLNNKMSENIKKIKKITSSEYKYGFVTKIKEDRIPNGLNIDIIKIIYTHIVTYNIEHAFKIFM